MGVVYLARHVASDRLVAIKVIRNERLTNPDILGRFRREAQAASRLCHPNIVAVHQADLVQVPGLGEVHFLAMEYVPGITLQKLVEDTGPLAVAQACDFVRQAALGLQHAAEQGLVHRDIKPSNLMVLVPNGLPLPPRAVVKILDMGVARLSQNPLHQESLTTLTRDGAVIGTPDYIAPEQLENPREADSRADLYSLGCTFYFLLSGQVPFPGGSLIQKLDRQRWQTAVSVDQIRREVPPGVARLVRRLMAKHPDDRFGNPGELASALEQLSRTGELPGSQQPIAVRELGCLLGHTGAITGLVFTPDGTLISGSTDRTLRVWDVAAHKERLHFGDGRHEIGCLAFVPARTPFLLAGQGVTIRGWEPNTGREILKLNGHSDAVRGMSVSRDGQYAVSGGDDKTVRLWDLQTGRELQRFPRHAAGVTGVALSPDGKLVASSGRDQVLRLSDAQSGREVRTLGVPRGPVLCVAFSPDGRRVLSGHFDTTLRLWDVATGREERRFSGHRQMVSGLAFTHTGTALSVSHDQTLRAWDPASGAELWSCHGHTGPVTCVAVQSGNPLMATGGFDQGVRLWQMPS
jgi:WD40 repeat protein